MKKLLITSLLAMPSFAFAQEDVRQATESIYDCVVKEKSMTNMENHNRLSSGFAPPTNDNCASATNIVVGTTLLAQTTVGATTQTGESFGCFNNANQSVWYQFIATATTHVATISLVATSGCYFTSAVWGPGSICVPTGPCSPISCQSASGGPLIHEHVLTQLIVGQRYYVQVTYNTGGPCGNGPNAGLDFNIGIGNTQTQAFPSNPAPLSTCQSPSGPGCVFGTPPTVAQVTGGCPAYQNPILGPSIGNEVVRACFTVATGLYNTSIAVQNIIQSNCGSGNVVWFNYTILNSACQVVACGNLSNLVVSNLACQTPYTFCLMYEIPAGCSHTQFWPYVNSNNIACTPLPIELLWFDAKAKDGIIELSWKTATELDNDYFIVEKSSNGVDFTEAVRFSGLGNTSVGYEYQTFDLNPHLGVSYYRLRQVDFNGTSVISSDIVPVNIKTVYIQNFSFSDETKDFSFVSDEIGKISFFSADGRLTKEINVFGSEQIISLLEMPEGIYAYRFLTKSGRFFSGKIIR